MKCSKKTKRLFSVLLVLAMCFTLLPSMTLTAFADESYDLWVGGVQVTSSNAGNVYVYYSPGNCMWPGVEMTKSDDQYKATVNSDALTVSGGSVTAVGNNGALFTAPTLGSDVTAVASANIDGTDQVSYDASQNDSYKWFRATETNTDLTIGGKSEWEFGDTIEFGSEEFYYIYDEDRSVYHTNGDATLRYERWSSTYKQHLIYLYILPTQYYIYIQPEDYEAETPQTPAGLKLIGGNGTEDNPYEFAIWYKYTVNLTAGANMTKTSGEGSQTVKEGDAITDVVYTANDGYCFPETYSVEAVNGITVTRNSATQITVSGTPTGNVDITLTAPSAHSPAAAVKENEHSASCEGSGSFDEVIYCAVCGEEISRTPRTIDPLGHNWGIPSYSWADDNKKVTASRVCGRDASHIDSETVNTASEVTKQATVTAKGETTYTATFTKTAFTTQTKTVADIPMLVPTFTITFNANGGTVTPAKDETDTDGKLTSLPTPTRSGYSFNGWFTAASGGTKITTETVFDAEAEIFAQWTKNSRSRGGGGGGGSTPVTYTVTSGETDNGSVTVNPKDATKGSTVTITVTPDEGYKLDKLTVTDKDGKDVEVTEKDGEYTFTMPAGKVDVTPVFVKEDIEPTTPPADPTPMPTDDENPFTDIAKGDYFYDAVLWAAEKDITQGTSDMKFSPNESCTRAQTVAFLWRTAGSPEPNTADSPFADIKADDYFYKAVLWAYENGITKGTSDTTFSPHDTVTRGQTVTFLYRMKGEKASVENPFEDVFEGDYYYDPVLWAYENEITSGTTDTTFSPADNCLRGQIVTFLYRCYK
ncbi:MAG: S-layer homology domain-containing protein [Clostridia bacterium]|nr:S-layer homology domain-containing protein [Clostridia bacterium]